MRRRLAAAALMAALCAPPAGAETAEAQPARPPEAPEQGELRVLPPSDGAPEDEKRAQTVAPPAEEVVAALSHNHVSITTTYAGSEIFIFGAVKRVAPGRARPVEVIATISGPSTPVAVRRKGRVMGIWANVESVTIDRAPSFYAVAASAPVAEVLSQTADLQYRISLEQQVRAIGAAGEAADPGAFRQSLIRLRREQGLYVRQPLEMRVIEDTLFAAHVALPANIVEGDYRARVFLLQDGEVVDLHESVVDVRKVGLERWIFALSRSEPLLYGVLSLVVALLAGWSASEVFRRLRR